MVYPNISTVVNVAIVRVNCRPRNSTLSLRIFGAINPSAERVRVYATPAVVCATMTESNAVAGVMKAVVPTTYGVYLIVGVSEPDVPEAHQSTLK